MHKIYKLKIIQYLKNPAHTKHQPCPSHKQKPNKAHIPVLAPPATHKPPQNFSHIKKRTRVSTDQKSLKKGPGAPLHNSLLNDDLDTSFQTTSPPTYPNPCFNYAPKHFFKASRKGKLARASGSNSESHQIAGDINLSPKTS